MKQVPFDKLMKWAETEYENRARPNNQFSVLGPAAGPHTQLSQNIIAAYIAGGRFFELKTVQELDGEDLPVAKPCISVPDEGYNVEWSTELYVPQAMEEYIKAWYALGLLGGSGFIFNMSVGYDLKGIQTAKIDNFIEGLKNAENTEIWAKCKKWAKENGYTAEISPHVSNSITLSTLHGCPPDEIERIATYLIREKNLNTFIKCNPTLLGYEYARKTLDDLGFDYLTFDDHHFKADLQFEDAVPMLKRLGKLAERHSLEFGVKLTNTFPVKITDGELPGEEMYMSGRPLYPLALALAHRLSQAFDGKLRISFSGGADARNITQLYEAGIFPITVATTLLKPGGYKRLTQLSHQLDACESKLDKSINTAKLQAMLDDIPNNPIYRKPLKPIPNRKLDREAPKSDCAIAPCREACPLHQDIPVYLRLAGEGKYLEALRVITNRNPLPFITGTICSEHCASKCTRVFYDEAVHVRSMKLEIAEKAYDALLSELKPPKKSGGKIAIIGGGPAGLAAAYFLAREGRPVTIFEKRGALGGIVRHLIPEFRITHEAIDKDIALVLAMGAEVKLNTEAKDLEGFEHVIAATGAWKSNILKLEEGEAVSALAFLEEAKRGPVNLGENVVVIGGGNTAMDAARAAKRTAKNVSIVYRRTKKQMPADEHELQTALAEGVILRELLSPIAHKDGKLICDKATIPADTVISAIGDSPDHSFVNAAHIIGDANSPATIAHAIADALACAEAITGKKIASADNTNPNTESIIAKKGIITTDKSEPERCLECASICENCVDVCPNRANIVVPRDGKRQILHIDDLCNECGNCEMFCPYSSAPYKQCEKIS